MIAPLVIAVGTWVAVERTHQANPSAVTAVMMGGFLGKMVFFGAYVVIVLQRAVGAAGAVRHQLHGVFHRVVSDRGALPEAPVCGNAVGIGKKRVVTP